MLRQLSLLFLILVTAVGCSPSNPDHKRDHIGHDEYLQLPIEERRKPENATASFSVADDLEVALFASEPMVVNPTNMDIDRLGRVWVLESPNYGKPADQRTEAGGRITILEDQDGDGKADKSTLFYQGEDVETALGIAVLGNKVYVTRSPNLLVFTDEDGDDQPDEKEILITGMGKPGDHSSHAMVFGPDGKFYWNMGNYAGPVKDASGNIVVDQMGNPVEQYGKDYVGGMVFRCNPDITEFEVLAHNFRNNYEVTVDSYGTMWQSDNDDDGNKSVRINYVMEYGNYGYLDEITRESWGAFRTNLEPEIARRHWHQNDPGVVPNLLITGAGSPAGITVYEGGLLPEPFHEQMLHADAGPNVARAYPVTKSGAGYTATMLDLVKTELDQWFRPTDITVAPDGSVFIADWYDPLVGGGAAGEFDKGRIFRVAPNTDKYSFPKPEMRTLEGAIEAIKSPNMSMRYLGWNALHEKGEQAEDALLGLFRSENPVFQARALWLLGKIEGKSQHYVELGLSSANPDIRSTAIRLARQCNIDFLKVASKYVSDPAPEVLRELAIALHPYQSMEAASIWTALANRHLGQDRWYLEALGIGAANNWENCLNTWMSHQQTDLNSKSARDIIWRSRAPQTMEMLAALIDNKSTDQAERLRYFRAFDFLDYPNKNQVLTTLLESEHKDQDQIRVLALQHMDTENLSQSPALLSSLDRALIFVQGSPEYINLVSKFHLENKVEDLLALTIAHAGEPLGVEASKVILNEFEANNAMLEAIEESDQNAMAIVKCIQHHGGTQPSLALLRKIVLDSRYPLETRKEAVSGLGKSWPGETELLECVRQPSFDTELHPIAASVLFNVYRRDLQEQAAEYLERPGSSGGSPLPPIRNLIASNGNTQNGSQIFETYCQTCHMVGQQGIAFGPALTEIGGKLSREGLYRAIIYPNEGINHGYHGSMVRLKDGTITAGIIESEAKDFIEIKLMGGVKNKILRADIESIEQSPQSLMPNLSTTISQEQLVDLVEYLSSLRSS